MAINEGVAPYPSCLCPGFFARASTKGNDFSGGSIIITIIYHVTLLTCWECRFTYLFSFFFLILTSSRVAGMTLC